MKTLLYLFIFLPIALYSQDWLWEKQSGGTNHSAGSWDIKTDKDGNSYVTGEFRSDTCRFGNVNITGPWGATNIFIAKYSKDGDCIWAKPIIASTNLFYHSFSRKITIDNLGNCYINGDYQDHLIFGGTDTINGNGAFLAKYDTSGNYIWVQTIQIHGNLISGLTTDISGHVYISGSAPDTAIFEMDTLFGPAAFITKYDSSGNIIRVTPFYATAGAGATSIHCDDLDNLFVTGSFNDSINIDNNYFISSDTTHSNIFIAKLDTTGTYRWATTVNGKNNQRSVSITADLSGNSFITGEFIDTAYFGNDTLINANASTDFFIAKYDSAGTEQWVRQAGGTYVGDRGLAICTDNLGNCYVKSCFEYSFNINGTSYNSNARFNHFILKYDASGNLVGLFRIMTSSLNGNTSVWARSGISIDQNSNIYTVGVLDTGYAIFNSDTLFNPGSTLRSYIAKVGCEGTPPQISFNGNNLSSTASAAYQWFLNGVIISGANSQNYSPLANGNYMVIVTDSSGCKSTSNIYTHIELRTNEAIDLYQNNIYPNPVNKEINISNIFSLHHFQLFDRYGKEVLYSHSKTIDLSMLADGVYIYKLWIDANKFIPGKIVVMKN